MISRRAVLPLAAVSAVAPVALLAQSAVPKGTLTKATHTAKKFFPGTTRDYWVYVPAQYKASEPAALMIFFDGEKWVNETGRYKAQNVFDTLIASGDMPVTIGLFVNPGVLAPKDEGTQMARYNRSLEYDGLGDANVNFLLQELLPEVEKTYKLTSNPNLRGLGGSSSGAIAAFTAAWNRPDSFRRVLSYIGSYVNLRGGDIYGDWIRKFEPKPLRIFLQDGKADLNIFSGSWYLANLKMQSALDYAGYDYKWVEGTDGHNDNHGAAIFVDAMKWLWRDWKSPIVKATGNAKAERHFVTEFLDPASEWEELSSGHGFTEGPAVDKDGNVFFSDIPQNKIYRIDAATNKVTLWKEQSGGVNGMMFGSDGRLYTCQSRKRQIAAFRPDGTEDVLATEVDSNDLVLNSRNELWWTDPRGHRIWFLNAKGEKRVVQEGLEFPNGVILSPDQSLLMAVDYRGKWVWSFQLAPDGSLENGEAFYHLETRDLDSQSFGDGMSMDTEGHLYVATSLGIQICDQPGRVVGVINSPQGVAPSNVVFGGKDLDWLYVTAREKVFRRHMRRKGLRAWAPVKPPRPRL